jgi:hypothetical protein
MNVPRGSTDWPSDADVLGAHRYIEATARRIEA